MGEMKMLQELTNNKYYVLIGIIAGIFCIIFGIMGKSILIFVLGLAVLGIQLIKIKHKKVK